MIHKTINFPILSFNKAVINCIMIVSFIINISSCTTTEVTYLSPKSLKSGNTSGIKKIELKNGNVINCKGKLIKFEGGSDSAGFIVVSTADTVRSGNNSYSIRWNEERIPETDIKKIQIEKTEADTTKTLLVILGAAAGIALAYFIVLAVAINGANLK